jgi:hypothetical protein
MNEVPCGPAPDEELYAKLDSLLFFLGNLESDVKELQRRAELVEETLMRVAVVLS